MGKTATILLTLSWMTAAPALAQLPDLLGITPQTVSVTSTDVATRIENTELSITYTPGTTEPGRPAGWWHGSRSRGWSAGTASFNRSSGARASFSFNGTSLRWIGFRSPWAGIANVYLDGMFITEVDLYAPEEHVQDTIFSALTLMPGAHTFVVESTGRKNAQSVDYAVVVDAFDVGPAAPSTVNGTRIEENSSAVTYTSGWTAGDTRTAWSDGRAAVSATAGARATVTVTGTSAYWVGLRGPDTGIARVYLDGAFQREVDTFAAYDVLDVVFFAGNLAPASHTLTIEATGVKNAGSTDASIFIDAFDVNTRFEETNAAIAYTAGWRLDRDEDAFSGTSGLTGMGTAAASDTPNDQAVFTFAGSAVSWIGSRGPSRGIARVYVDGVAAADVDTFAPGVQPRSILFRTTGLADATHTITVETTGGQNPSATGATAIVDAFDVNLPPSVASVVRYQETDPSAAFTDGWTTGSTFAWWSGEHAMYSSTAGAQATFTFTGQNVRWLGDRGFGGGIARVYVDGVFVADVDTHARVQEEYQAALFVATGLDPGSHSLTIEVTGTAAPNSSGTQIVVDAFDVY